MRRGAGAVRAGRTISLTLPYDGSGPQDGVLRSNPRLVATATGLDYLAGTQDFLPGGGTPKGFGYSDDILIMDGQAGTQWDSLSHIFWDGRMWNGRSAAESTSSGAAANGVQNYTGRIVTRGLLVDVPAMLGVESLEPGHAITTEDIESFLAEHGLTVEPGDALLVRTGFLAARREKWGDYARRPGTGALAAHRPLAARPGNRRGGHRHLGRRGPPERDRGLPAAPRRLPRPRRDRVRGDVRPRHPRPRLRRGRSLRVHADRVTAAADGSGRSPVSAVAIK
ncbi:cyclase family protein [Actinomadura madurae]|uniref:cyclase family protein n=1 Tax=Actinomadura madurae TaxID=1993 RepID=UPI0020D21D2A|nr:cyclase family protein [Actinomadura madurae]MCQ0007093.1 cyclase family protein [Actinomadura madurae]